MVPPATQGTLGSVPPGKPALKTELLALLAADLETLERAHRATTEGATHEEAKPENDKDTRALEQSYLARGQAARIEALRAGIAGVTAMPVKDFEARPAAVGALVTVDEDGEESTLLLAPAGGGARLAGGTVQVVTPPSPLGRAVLGKQAGDDVELVLAGKTRAMQVVRVA
jgi:transcription elongation GreA/GreB family factor